MDYVQLNIYDDIGNNFSQNGQWIPGSNQTSYNFDSTGIGFIPTYANLTVSTKDMYSRQYQSIWQFD